METAERGLRFSYWDGGGAMDEPVLIPVGKPIGLTIWLDRRILAIAMFPVSLLVRPLFSGALIVALLEPLFLAHRWKR